MIAETFSRRNENCTVFVVEPNTQILPEKLSALNNVVLSDLNELPELDVAVITVAHDEFLGLDREFFSNAFIIDTKGLLRD